MVQNYFEIIVQKMVDLGFYSYAFPAILTLAIVWALLTKSKVLGEKQWVVGTISIIAAALVLGFPVITGQNLSQQISVFFTQSMVVLLVLVVGLMIAGLVHPKLFDFLGKWFEEQSFIWIVGIGVVALFIISGLVQVLWTVVRIPLKAGEVPGASGDVMLLAAALMVFIVLIIIASNR